MVGSGHLASSALVVNVGSSSVRCAVLDLTRSSRRSPIRRFSAHADRGMLRVNQTGGSTPANTMPTSCRDLSIRGVIEQILGSLRQSGLIDRIAAVGHRIVHGGEQFTGPVLINQRVLDRLRQLEPLAPLHNPREIEAIEAVTRDMPHLPQIACFDTAFHRDLPDAVRYLPIPRRFHEIGVRRYGFHGLSYAYLFEELANRGAHHGRIVLAHLGNGASMAAVHEGKCVDTTMAMTPTAGLMMATRSGDIDPGLAGYFAQAHGMGVDVFNRMVESESGMLGVSATSGDVRDLLRDEETDARAHLALEMFTLSAGKSIAGLCASLGGLDTLVFSGGIGEHAAPLRRRICERLSFLGVQLDEEANTDSCEIISAPSSHVSVRVIATDEEAYIANCIAQMLERPFD